ncbi:hypothetical protein E5161_09240 [Cohnella pontilimi]|uniref:SLH domain-containing protein n=1 Tax=Cohnella pontilimi TaxID=2564100 RepID=A0A4U0FBF8_9BACL|nr:Ig-like domain-containing protein [Cohnella pontilimi]TJY42183.1 hypothetical protein E5161_09240 [Cohnella pontilimi]
MRKALLWVLSLALLFSLPITAAGATSLTTEQKFEILKQKGIFSGFSDGSSRLYQSMTREQFAVVLFKLFEMPEPNRSPTYVDVIKTRWSFQSIEAVTKAGLMSGVGNRKFSPESPVTVEQLCSVLVRSYGFSGNGVYVSGKVSAWARASVGIALQNNLIPEMKDYTLPATRGLLVEAAYAVYVKTQVDPLKVRSVDPVSNQLIRVTLNQAVSSVSQDRFLLKDILGVTVNIQQAILAPDGLSVTLVTDRQVSGRTHTLYIDGTAYVYTAPSDDTTKPVVSSFSRSTNGVLQIVFSEQVDRNSAINSANYSFNNGLRLTSIQLSDDKRVVTMTTSGQNEGTHYTLTVRNVKDLAGNVMDAWSTTFLADNKKPTAAFSFNDSTAVITLTFSEKVNAQQAVSVSHYSIDKGVAVVRADLDADGKTVYLRTSAQRDATLYTLTVSGIPDLAGNVMDTQTFVFAGVANPVQSIQLQSISAENENTLLITFNRALSDDDVNKLGTAVLTDNGNTVSMSGWSAFKMRVTGNDRAVTVQFRTSGDASPDLFRPGHVYLTRVTGIPNLVTTNNANQLNFAGTERANAIPEVASVTAINATSVKVTFSEPVKNVSKAAFLLKEQDGTNIRISADSLNSLSKVTTEVVLTLTDPLQSGHLYVMSFVSGTVTDAAGWNGWKTKSGTDDFTKTFRGV